MKKDKLVGTIKYHDMFVFKGLLEKHRLDSHEFKTNPGYAMINNIRSVPTYEVNIKDGKPSFYIHVKMDARIQELSRKFNLENKKYNKIAKSIENN